MNQTDPQSDHDVLIELRTEMRAVRSDVKDLRESIDDNTADHETRIRVLETKTDGLPLLTKVVYGAVAIVLIAFMGALVYTFIVNSRNIPQNSVTDSVQ